MISATASPSWPGIVQAARVHRWALGSTAPSAAGFMGTLTTGSPFTSQRPSRMLRAGAGLKAA
jgi:hypothetical protein